MDYEIYKDGSLVNTITADESFVKRYCEMFGYTYKERQAKEQDTAPTAEDRIAALEKENHLLSQQVNALSDQNDFHEELIVELANIVYA